MYNFKKFTRVGSKFGSYSISLNASNSFYFHSGFYNKEHVDGYKKVVLFYDKKENAVAFQFTNDIKADGAFTISHRPQGATGSVAAHSFINANAIDVKKFAGKKNPKKIRDEEFGSLYVVKLAPVKE